MRAFAVFPDFLISECDDVNRLPRAGSLMVDSPHWCRQPGFGSSWLRAALIRARDRLYKARSKWLAQLSQLGAILKEKASWINGSVPQVSTTMGSAVSLFFDGEQ
jgi:hypothetical protein